MTTSSISAAPPIPTAWLTGLTSSRTARRTKTSLPASPARTSTIGSIQTELQPKAALPDLSRLVGRIVHDLARTGSRNLVTLAAIRRYSFGGPQTVQTG